jgi:hypothetical protein
VELVIGGTEGAVEDDAVAPEVHHPPGPFVDDLINAAQDPEALPQYFSLPL